ncbi:hypothetical protein AAHH67_27325 [Niallia circulans]
MGSLTREKSLSILNYLDYQNPTYVDEFQVINTKFNEYEEQIKKIFEIKMKKRYSMKW